MPERRALKFRKKCSKYRPQVFREWRIGLHPLHKHSAGREMPLRRVIKLAREQRGDPRDPRIRRLGNNEVILFARSEQKVAGIIDSNVKTRILEHIAV